MNRNYILVGIVILCALLMIYFPYRLAEGFFMSIIAFAMSLVISMQARFKGYKNTQIFFSCVFIVLLIVAHMVGVLDNTGNIFNANFPYFLRLSIIPMVIMIILGGGVFWFAMIKDDVIKGGLSAYLAIYFALMSVVSVFSVMLYALASHSV